MVILDSENIIFEVIKEGIKLPNNKNILNKLLKSDEKISDELHVITYISNYCEFKRRTKLMIQFIEHMNQFDNIKLYVVEMIYEGQEFTVTKSNNPNHLQLKTKHVLWHKENMINLGIKKLLPENWKAVAWIDGDLEFNNLNWVNDTLKLLTHFDIIQLFSTCFDLDENNIPMNIWESFGYKYCHGETFTNNKDINYWHPGYAWACNRSFYDKINFIYDKGILGSGDYVLTQGIFNNVAYSNKHLEKYHNNIKDYIKELNYDIKVGYVPTTIRHYFHGSKANRKYIERKYILFKYNYDPNIHIEYDINGVLQPTEEMSKDFIKDIEEYFYQRNDDEYYELLKKNI